jgi:hypothetical protein
LGSERAAHKCQATAGYAAWAEMVIF